MQIQISFCSEEQYEEDERGFTFSGEIPAVTFFSLLQCFDSVLEDYPHYHVQLKNTNGERFYLIFELPHMHAEL